MTKTLGIVQARMGSSRLPGKAMIDLAGRPSLDWVTSALKAAPGVDEILVATSDKPADDVIAQWATKKGIRVYRGSEDDVLSRYMGAVNETGADIIIRTTGDCPLIDPDVIGQVIKLREVTGVDYATNTDPGTWPDGQDVEVFTRRALEAAYLDAVRPTDRECVTRFIVRNRKRFPAANMTCPIPGLHKERWVLDSAEDLQFIREITKRLGDIDRPPNYLQILNILDREPTLRQINGHLTRNERFYDGLTDEAPGRRSYHGSQLALRGAESLIPMGAQTFSKSRLVFPEGAAPLFVTHGDGAYVFDVDGNDYVDLVGALLPNILGYRDPDVDYAIRDQLDRGISFSLATELEAEVAELLHKHIPSAEMVKFGKNGSDVTTGAVRLARLVTGREKVIVGGYHGWHDWSVANTMRDTAVPSAVKSLSLPLLDQEIAGDVAAVIVEPEFFTIDALAALRKACSKSGAVLIFDEIISGFRFHLGGLQALYGITPDLSTFGKAIANGMPLSALVGHADLMKRMPEISYSGTFFGETLSLAAAKATITKLDKLNIPHEMNELQYRIRRDVRQMICDRKLEPFVQIKPPLNRVSFLNNGFQTLFIQEMAKNGVLIIASHNLSYAIKEPEIRRILKAWEKTLDVIQSAIGKPLGDFLDAGLVQSTGVR